tara:strand:+ start:4076 stop:4243 length:168 start_codon:yes stop_codon:yes gene_type:complete
MKEKYYIIISMLFVNAIILAQGVNFPNEPAQAPVGGLGLLAVVGAALAYKKLRNK